jgi:hypothetical protein
MGIKVAILFYQMTIFVSLVLTRWLAPRLFRTVCLAWTAFTAINLFWPPLIILQLVVIWGTFRALGPSGPTPGKDILLPDRAGGSRESKEEAGKWRLSDGLHGTPTTNSAAPSLVRQAQTVRAGAGPDSSGQAIGLANTISRFMGGIDERVDQELAVNDATSKMRRSYFKEHIRLTSSLESAELTLDLARKKQKDPQFAENYRKVQAALRRSDTETVKSLPDGHEIRLTDFTLPPPHSDRAVTKRIEELYEDTIEEYSSILTQILQKLHANPCLRDLFEKALLSRGGAEILRRMLRFEAGNEWRYPSCLTETPSAHRQIAPRSAQALNQSEAPLKHNAPNKRMTLGEVFAKLDRNRVVEKKAISMGIPFLVHFTRAGNLPSIFEHGLCSIARAEELRIAPHINDALRLDGRPNAISLSIAFPNHKMFFKYRQEYANEKWAVLQIEPAVMWSKKCGFCERNAADHRIRDRPIPNLVDIDAFDNMYKELDGVPTRSEQRLFAYDPTDPQAEVLAFETIHPDSIIGIAFDDVQVART